MASDSKAASPIARTGLILLCTAAGVAVFFVGVTFAGTLPTAARIASRAALILGLPTLTWALYRNAHLNRYWRLTFSYFVAACAVFLSNYAGDWAARLSGHAPDTAAGFTALKLGEDAAIVGTIVLLALLSREPFEELYLSKGRLGLSLAIGLSAFVLLAFLGVSSSPIQSMPPDRARALLPMFVSVSLADGFTEELLFRGLFLKKLEQFIGIHWANVVTATVFALTHLGVQLTASLPVFFVTLFLLGLLWGWIMQKTGSVLAPALLHAGVDMLIIADAFKSFGLSG